MQTVPIQSFGNVDREGLKTFLGYCQKQAAERDHSIIASITLPSDFLDPLAVLESVNDPNVEHCYLERHASHEGVACAEPVLKIERSGENRFNEAQACIEEWKAHAILVGDCNLPWAGPRFFSSIAFESETSGEGRFLDDALVMFLPRWQVGWKGAEFSATANVLVSKDTPIDLLVEPIWRAHERFTSFDFEPDFEFSKDEGLDQIRSSECRILDQNDSEQGYLQSVRSALELIHAGTLEKLVISRSIKVETTGKFVPLEILNKLRTKYPDCCAFSFQNSNMESFIGASPERLVRVKNGVFETEALAGSIERGGSARQDAYYSKQLLKSSKDRNEHGLVLQFIKEALQENGFSVETSNVPEILQLSNIQHLRVPLRGELPDGKSILDLVQVLHPTPALGGYPQDVANQYLQDVEGFQRGRYGGLTGWIDLNGNGEFIVNIRCARVSEKDAKLFAGAGIVSESNPKKELEETELKLIGMLPNFMNLD